MYTYINQYTYDNKHVYIYIYLYMFLYIHKGINILINKPRFICMYDYAMIKIQMYTIIHFDM